MIELLSALALFLSGFLAGVSIRVSLEKLRGPVSSAKEEASDGSPIHNNKHGKGGFGFGPQTDPNRPTPPPPTDTPRPQYPPHTPPLRKEHTP